MRIIQDGEYITKGPFNVTNITTANPAVVTADAILLATVAANVTTPGPNTALDRNYLQGETVTLEGGTYITQAQVFLQTTQVYFTDIFSPGTSGYAPGDTITLAGGTFLTAAVIQLVTTQVVSATVAAGGAGGTPGTANVVGTTGTGTLFTANVTISGGGAVTGVNSIVYGGDYTVNPTTDRDWETTWVVTS